MNFSKELAEKKIERLNKGIVVFECIIIIAIITMIIISSIM